MPPTLADRLAHILVCIDSIEHLLTGKSQADLVKDRHLRLSLEREFEIICEAARKIPEKIKDEEISIDWRAMADLGNRLRHAYHRIDIDILFSIAEADLPPLKVFVERVIEEESEK